MSGNFFDQFDSTPSAPPAPPQGVVEGPQPNFFDQFDPKPAAAPPAAAPAPTPQPQPPTPAAPAQQAPQPAGGTAAQQLGQNPAAGDYPQPGPVGGTIQQQVSQAQGGDAPNPLGQAESQEHQEKVQQAITPPNIAESAIPEPVSPNPQPPQVAPAESQQQVSAEIGVKPEGEEKPLVLNVKPEMDIQGNRATPQFASPTPNYDVMGQQTQVVPGADKEAPVKKFDKDLPKGAYRDEQGIVHNDNVPKWLDTLMSISQKAGTEADKTVGGYMKSAGKATAGKEATALTHGFVGTAGAETEKAAGEMTAGIGAALNNKPPEYSEEDFKQAKEALLSQGDLANYHSLEQIESYQKEHPEIGPVLYGIPAQIEKTGQQVAEAGAGTQKWWDDWAKQHGVDPKELKAVGAGASIEGLVDAVGGQANQLLITGGVGRLGAKMAMTYTAQVNPKIIIAATRGNPVAQDAVKRIADMSANMSVATAQSIYVGGVAGAEATERVKKMPRDYLASVSPEYRDAVLHGADPKETQEDIAMKAGYRAQIFALATTMAANKAGNWAESTGVGKAVAGAIPGKSTTVNNAVNNAVLQGTLQLSSNYGMKLADPTQPIMQGVVGQTVGGAFVGGAFGLAVHEEEGSVFGREHQENVETHAALKRAALIAKARAGQDNVDPQTRDDLLKQAEEITNYRQLGKYDRAAALSSNQNEIPTPHIKALKPSGESLKEAASDSFKTYLAANNEDAKLGPHSKRLMNISMLDRWSQLDGGHTTAEYANAAKILTNTGELPPEIAERVGSDFNPNGTLSNAALINDTRLNPGASIMHTRAAPEQVPMLVDALRNDGVNPYVTPHGDVAILGAGGDLATLQERMSQQFAGTQFTVTRNHNGSQDQGTGAAEGTQSNARTQAGNEAGEGTSTTENGAVATPDEVGTARQVTTSRSQPVIERLGKEGVAASVSGDGRVVVQPNQASSEAALNVAANDAAHSQQNDRKEPTPAQKREGNYPKGKILFTSPKGDIPVNIENPAGSIRKSLPGTKPAWSRRMTEHYGYIPGTYSKDGEPVDVVVGRKAHDDTLPVFVLQQTKADGTFDEHKVVMGARTEREARDMYLKQYPQSLHDSLLQGQTKVVRMSREQFNGWVDSGDHDVPINPMSKQPMLKMREAPTKLEAKFADDADLSSIDDLNDRLGLELKVDDDNNVTGDVPAAKASAVDRALKRIDGHEQTQFDGNPARSLYAGEGERDGGRVPEGREAGPVAQPIAERSSSELPRRSGQETQATPPSARWMKKPESDAPEYANGKGDNPVSMVGVKYDLPNLTHLQSKGSDTDFSHLMTFQARESRDLPEGKGQAYEVRLNNLYDVRSDPDGIIARAEKAGADNEAILGAITKSGYDGVVMPSIKDGKPVAMMVGKQDIPVKAVSGDQRFMFAGDSAHKADITKMHTAKLMEATGATKEAISKDTGWHKGADKRWRFEIDDSQAKIKPDTKWAQRAGDGGVHLSSVLEHEELFKQYPDLRHFMVHIDDSMDESAAATGYDAIRMAPPEKYGGQWTPETREALMQSKNKAIREMGEKNERPSFKSVLLHELQHVIQDKEGFARGGNPDEFERVLMQDHMKPWVDKIEAVRVKYMDALSQGDTRKVADLMSEAKSLQQQAEKAFDKIDHEAMSDQAMDAYLRLAGETEARNTASRMDMTAEERAAKHPTDTAEFPHERQIVAKNHEKAQYSANVVTNKDVSAPAEEEKPLEGKDLDKHVATIQRHVDAMREGWKDAPEATVVHHQSDLPEAVAAHLDTAIGPDSGAEGVYYNGKVYLVGDRIKDRAHAEYVVAHETLGHFGLRGTFGDRLDNMLNEIHESVKDSPEFAKLEKQYGGAYDHLNARDRANALTEEYLSNRAVLQEHPGVLKKVVAWVRNWARQQGLVSKWSDNDIAAMLDGVADNVRQGRVSMQGLDHETATFDNDMKVKQTYHGAAGEGSITHLPDGSREVQIGDTKATVSRVMDEHGTGMLVHKLSYETPEDLLAITRLAGEEAKSYVIWPKANEADLKAANIPTERIGNFVQTPTSRVGDQPARFSIKNQPEDPALRARIDRVLQIPESSLTPWDRFQHAARRLFNAESISSAKDRFLQATADARKAIARDEMKINGGTLLDASDSAYKMAWMSDNTREVMGSVMHLGVPKYENGSFVPEAGRKGLMNILMPLYQHEAKGFDRMWEFYAMARRGDQLSRDTNPDGTTKEKLLTPDDIKEGLALGEKYPVMKQVFDDWQTFNKQLLDLAVERGNMTREMADLWGKNDYVPFYRVADENELNPKGSMPGGLKVSSKRLYGSDKQVEPIIENIINNTQAVLRKVYKNEALRRTAAVGELAGTIERMPTSFKPVSMSVGEIESNLEKMGLFVGQQAKGTGGSAKLQITPAQAEMWTKFFRAQAPLGKDTFAVMENGKPVYYKVTDDLTMDAVGSLQKQQQLEKWFRVIFTMPKNGLTHLITLNPGFILRHLERQVTHTWVQSGENFNPFSHAIDNAKDAYNNSDFMKRMSMAGAGGNEYYDIDQMRESMRGLGVHSTILDTGHKVWMAYRKLGFVADQMNRMGIAKSVLERGGSTAEAAWQAQDLLNFRMHGGSNVMRHLIGAVPFMNARVQGLYRIARGAAGVDQSFKSRRSATINFMLKSAAVIAASQFLALRNNGDPRYERLPDELKANYWHLFVGNEHFAIAKPFEIGALFSTLPDSTVRYTEGLDGSRTFGQNLQRVLETVFRIDPIPGTVKPILDDWRNKDDLTQRPIVPESLQHVDPTLQSNPYTSPLLQKGAEAMPEFAPDALRSPLRFQHLVDGYVGSLGLYAIQSADAATRALGYAPASPAGRMGFPGSGAVEAVAGSMVGKVDTDPRNRYEGMIFEDKTKLDQIAATLTKYQKAGDQESLNRYYLRNRSAMEYKGMVMAGYRSMEQYNMEEKAIYTDSRMSPADKRAKLDEITKDKNRVLDNMAPLLNQADSAL